MVLFAVLGGLILSFHFSLIACYFLACGYNVLKVIVNKHSPELIRKIDSILCILNFEEEEEAR